MSLGPIPKNVAPRTETKICDDLNTGRMYYFCRVHPSFLTLHITEYRNHPGFAPLLLTPRDLPSLPIKLNSMPPGGRPVQ